MTGAIARLGDHHRAEHGLLGLEVLGRDVGLGRSAIC